MVRPTTDCHTIVRDKASMLWGPRGTPGPAWEKAEKVREGFQEEAAPELHLKK